MSISREVKVAVLAVTAGVLLYWGFNFLKGVNFFKKTQTYYAIYSNVGGLGISNQVTLDGVTVGRVSNIIINQEKHNVLVEMEIEGSIIVGDSAVARLTSDLLGTKSIALEIYDLTNPLEGGDTLIAAFDKGIEGIIESALPVTDNLPVTISKINAILDNFEGTGDVTKNMLYDIDTTFMDVRLTLSTARRNLDSLSYNMNELIDSLKYTNSKLPVLLDKFGQAADTISNLQINQTLDQLQKTLVSMEETMSALKSDEGTIGKLMTNDSVYNNLNQMLVSLDSLLNHINSNPKHFFGPLGKSRKKIEKDLARQKEQEN